MEGKEREELLDKFKKHLDEKVVVQKTGISWLSVLGIVFIVLKLTGTITWSWWWVLAPIWIPMALATVLVLMIVGADYLL